MKKWTLDEWNDFVRGNCDNSYSLAVCYAILLLAEMPDEFRNDEDEARKAIRGLGLSGMQADIALDFWRNNAIDGLPGANGRNPLL